MTLINIFFQKVYAACPDSPALNEVCGNSLPNSSQGGVTAGDISKILAIVFAIIGALAFLTIVIAGLRYITAAGNPEKTALAKSTILYALVGLALAILAEAIVAFVVRNL